MTTKFKSGLERTFHKQFPTLPYEALRLPYTVRHHYTPDFNIGANAAIELKGLWTGADRQKHLHIRQQHPNFVVLLCFQNAHRTLSKNSSTTYAQWCDRHALPWCQATDLDTIQSFIQQHRTP